MFAANSISHDDTRGSIKLHIQRYCLLCNVLYHTETRMNDCAFTTDYIICLQFTIVYIKIADMATETLVAKI